MFYKDLSPIIICGAHGGGTSFTTKMLRASGFFVGHDVEPFEARKFHESEVFRNVNIFIFKQLARDVNGMSNDFLDLYAHNYNEGSKIPHIVTSIEKNINKVLNKFSNNDTSVFDKQWGWKDPRNTLTLQIWSNFFPKGRILMIRKKVDNKSSKSGSGHWFRNASEREREFYFEPNEIFNINDLGMEVLNVDFEKITNVQDSFDEMLDFCRLESKDLNHVLKRCSYEG